MGLAHFVVLNSDLEGVDTSMDGKALAHQADDLAALAKSCGVPDLWNFHSQDPNDAMAFLESEGVEVETLEMPAFEEEWFEPVAGLRTVRALLGALVANPSAVGNAASVAHDLKQVERILETAESMGAKWHLAVDF